MGEFEITYMKVVTLLSDEAVQSMIRVEEDGARIAILVRELEYRNARNGIRREGEGDASDGGRSRIGRHGR
jgi:hypothetical protein